MPLKIKQQNSSFVLEGVINTTTVKQFKNQLELLLFCTKSLDINIENVHEIDRAGFLAIQALKDKAYNFNKKFSITGYGSLEI